MKADQKIILFLTFLTGILVGVTLYLTAFAPVYQDTELAEKSDFSIQGEQYGGCGMTDSCLTFRLEENGSYKYLYDDKIEEGTLPSVLTNEAFGSLSVDSLDTNSESEEKDDCISYVDGVDYRYTIVYEGVRYVLDSCRTTFSLESDFQESAIKAWDFMGGEDVTYASSTGSGLGGWFVNRFKAE